MRIAHFSDLHYCPKYLDEVSKCMDFAIDKAWASRCECAVISGDLFDHRLELHTPAVAAAVQAVQRLADAMPVLILQGTLLHDPAGCLEVFKEIGAKNPIFVADKLCQVYLVKNEENEYRWINVGDHADSYIREALFSCLPSINKGEMAAEMGEAYLPEMLGENTAKLLSGWHYENTKNRGNGLPTILVSHGTVSGSLTEQGCPMVGLDHEFTTGSLFGSGAAAIMLGHIHKHQDWALGLYPSDGLKGTDKFFLQRIAYAGSIGRLHFGEMDPKGFLIWEVQHDSADFELITTPAKELVDIAFEGAPDMESLKIESLGCHGKHVRIRYVLDEEHRNIVDRELIENLFKEAAELKIEPRILPIQRSRAEGITQKPLVSDKLNTWCQVTETDESPLQERLTGLLERGVEGMMKDLDKTIKAIALEQNEASL